jgi:manganese-dependent inorganic pyrophosphatase
MTSHDRKLVYVIGHTIPDTDSVCSAIGYAYFKNVTDKRFLFTPARAGRINEETSFILKQFNVPEPVELESLSATVSDLSLKRPIAVNARDSIQSLALQMRDMGVRAMPVVDDNRKLLGMVGLKDIARYYMDSVGFNDITESPINLDILIRTLDGHVVSNTKRAEYLSGRIHTAAMQKGTILNRISPGDIVIVGDQHDILADLFRAGCSAVIVTDGLPIAQDLIAAAQAGGIVLISSPHPAFATVQLMTMSEPVLAIMARNVSSVGLYTPISELRQKILESDYRSAVVVDSENRLIGFVTRTDLLTPIRKKAILVDHNEISQAVDGIDEAEILEIIDHHRVGDISTVAPIYVYNDPVGSTCTVVANLMFLHQVQIPAEIAGILLSGILSDTLILTLSTTTEKDRLAAERLAEIAGVAIKEYGKELLNESINVKNKSAAELIAADFKEFVISGRKLGISQMMVLNCEEIDWREKDLLAELERLRAAKGYSLTALLITNPLLASYERVLLAGDTWIVEKAFDVKVKEGTCILPRVMSRKKDFIPAVGQALSMEK